MKVNYFSEIKLLQVCLEFGNLKELERQGYLDGRVGDNPFRLILGERLDLDRGRTDQMILEIPGEASDDIQLGDYISKTEDTNIHIFK